MSNEPLSVVLLWHMHQPEYRNPRTGVFQLPWTYLHGIKDYVDMAAHLEHHPEARVVVNFAPVLLEQLDEYVRQVRAYLADGSPIHDPLLSLLADPVLPVDEEGRHWLIRACMRINRPRMLDRFPAYHRLVRIAEWFEQHEEALAYLDQQFLVDLLVWYHLAWMGETVRRSDRRIRELMDKGRMFTLSERRRLLGIIADLLDSIIPRYRQLWDRGQIEVSLTPYAHPISPLLLDLGVAEEALPDIKLPLVPHYPGGEPRSHWHLHHALEVFQGHFGRRPRGCWPAEGGLSRQTLELLAEHGFQWTASGEAVLRNSLKASGDPLKAGDCIHRAYRVKDAATRVFFRDDGLSDLIGFQYADWHAEDAVDNLVGHLENIEKACEGAPNRVASIILDGENAWEHYPENGFPFLDTLYDRLASHPRLRMSTYAEVIDQGGESTLLDQFVAGSWVFGTFSTWIGDPDKNRGWDMLGDAKRCFDEVMARDRLSQTEKSRAERQLAICEGSDWFWWFGDYNDSEIVSDFERLYRLHLATLYEILGETPPEYLSQTFTRGSGEPSRGGVMRPGREGGDV